MESEPHSSFDGQVLGGTYRIEERLGAGGMGAVYRATHQRTGRAYAVKVLLPEVARRRDAMERFRREADAVAALEHANVVAVHDFAVEGDVAYLVMDLLEGEDLAARLRRTGPLPLDAALSIFAGMAAGLGAAHARGMVHRDLKPANVFLARQAGLPERPVLLDFGLAKSVSGDEAPSPLTATGVVMGTPQYMSPEQAMGQPLDARADLYSLAAILFEMLAGRPPLTAPTLTALLAKLVTDPAPPLETFRRDLPPGLSAVVARALAKQPSERFPDADALARAVQAGARSAHTTPATRAHGPDPTGSSGAEIDPYARTQASVAPPQAPPPANPAQASPRPAEPAPARSSRSWLVALVVGVLAIGALGVTALGVLYYLQVRSTIEQMEAIRESAPRGPSPDEVNRAIEEAVRQREQPAQPPPMSPLTPREAPNAR